MKILALTMLLTSTVALFQSFTEGDLFGEGLGRIPTAQESRSVFD